MGKSWAEPLFHLFCLDCGGLVPTSSVGPGVSWHSHSNNLHNSLRVTEFDQGLMVLVRGRDVHGTGRLLPSQICCTAHSWQRQALPPNKGTKSQKRVGTLSDHLNRRMLGHVIFGAPELATHREHAMRIS